MFQLSDLPRKDGLVVGQYTARHYSDSFDLQGYGFKFQAGATVEPVTGRTCDRLHAAFGSGVTFEPCDAETFESVIARASEYEPKRVPSLRAAKEKRFPSPKVTRPAPLTVPVPEPEPVKLESATTAKEPVSKPIAQPGKGRR